MGQAWCVILRWSPLPLRVRSKSGSGSLKDTSAVVTGQRMVKRVIAEMGGKNAIIIDETADLDDAVAGVMASGTSY